MFHVHPKLNQGHPKWPVATRSYFLQYDRLGDVASWPLTVQRDKPLEEPNVGLGSLGVITATENSK